MNAITVISLGPGRGECLTLQALDAIRSAQRLILRTDHTGAAEYLKREGIAFTSLDALYESAEDFDALNESLVQAVLSAAGSAPTVYAVPDARSDQSVRLLLDAASPVTVLPGIGLFEPIAAQHPDAHLCTPDQLPPQPGDEALLIVEMDSALRAGDVKLCLLPWFGPSCPCLWYDPSDSCDRAGRQIPLEDLDRQRRYDHTAAVYVCPQPLTDKERFTVQDLVRIMRILRGPDGCPWDREQTHGSLRPYLIEEAYEVTQAIRDEDWLHVADELGDVLLQVVFQANIGEQYGTLELSDITTAICRKMIRRHPHIFSDTKANTAADVSRNWEAIKRKERGQKELSQVLSDIPASLPPLMRAQKAQKKAEGSGMVPLRLPGALDALKAALQAFGDSASASQDSEKALGELLFACVSAARVEGVDAETALADATDRFIRSAGAREA